MISLNDYLTSSGRYPERAKSPELTPELLAAAQDYVDTANAFFNDLGVQPPPFSSGFRPKSVNAKIANAATLSGHTLCIAGDYEDDKNQSLGKKIIARPDLLRKHNLFMENLSSTIGKHTNWVHLDKVKRKDRPSRTFLP